MIAGNTEREAWQDYDPLIRDFLNKIGPSIFLRTLARLHEAPKYYDMTRAWIDQIDLHEDFYIKPTERSEGKGFGATEAARGALADWIVLEDGKIANYQVITPTAWNIGPKDGQGGQRPDGAELHRGAGRGPARPDRARPRRPQLRLLHRLHRPRLRRQDRQGDVPFQGRRDAVIAPGCRMSLVIGCGNLLRGDDAVGPVLVRRLLERGLPDGVEVADGGTSGMDVAFRMRGAERVILVDAATTGGEPGSVYRLTGDDVEPLPPLEGINLHSFRWDHALGHSRAGR